MQMIVLTGGPCAGKSTVLKAAAHTPGLVVVPEAATLLLEGPMPAPKVWTQEWQDAFQAAILKLQLQQEEEALERGGQTILCDRGLLDGAAYVPGGQAEYCRRFGLDLELVLNRYQQVIHLESLATARPELYGKGNNEHRFESLGEAQALEGRTRAAWHGHSNHTFLRGDRGLETTVYQALRLMRVKAAA